MVLYDIKITPFGVKVNTTKWFYDIFSSREVKI